MPRSLLLSCAMVLVLAGCDRAGDDAAQPAQGVDAAEASPFTGKIENGFAGGTIPVATLKDPAGKTLELASLEGQPVLLNLWATWCAPCVAEMPLLDKIAAETKGRLKVVTVSEDLNGAAAVTPFFAEHGFAELPQWFDPDNTLATAFGGGTALPLTVLYDAQGKEVWRVVGGYDWGSEEAKAKIAEAIG